MSSHHLKIYVENNNLFIEDFDSLNGTYIDSNKISSNIRHNIKENQKLTIGNISYSINKVKENLTQVIENDKDKNLFVIGRDIESDIYIGSDVVSFHHLIIKQENNEWYIIDNNSKNGTYLNNYKNKLFKEKLKKDDILYLATYKLNTNKIFNLIYNQEESIQKVQKVNINKTKILIGRNPDCDILIEHPNISWHHAKIVKENSQYFIYDLNSTNGTFINKNFVKDKQEIKENDKITLGIYSFIFKIENNKNLTLINIEKDGVRIDVKNISLIIKTKDKNNETIDKILLDDISFTIFPSEMVGLMGLSGAGKTTLLKVLSGYSKPTNGEVFINGHNVYKNYNRIKNFIGYVPQEDIIHPELTVYRALFYSSKLRLSKDVNDEEINNRIDEILQDLGISETKNTLIGSPNTEKGISGGQRKRVNIAMELLADPELLFLDEPTSGLSSVDTKVVMDKLKELSDKGKTIILTIHQPSLANYKKMDDIIILTHGELAYFGSNYPESIKFFNQNSTSQDILNDPDNALLGLNEGEKHKHEWKNIYKKSDINRKFVQDRAKDMIKSDVNSFSKGNNSSLFSQFKTLTYRYLNIKLQDKVNTGILLIQSPLIALLLLLLFAGTGYIKYQEDPNILLFILIISAIWFGVINSVREIVSEKAIYERERLMGLKLISYILSKFLILTILSFIQVVLLIYIVNFAIPLNLNILNIIFLIFITTLSGLGIGLFISAIAKSEAQALALVPIILLPMIIFAGGMIPIKDMPTNKYYLDAYRISFLMPTRWTLEEVIREFDNNGSLKEEIREPTTINESGTLIYTNNKIDIGSEATCQDRRCVETLYIKNDLNNNTYKFRNNPSSLIYIILILYIISPLLLTMIILKKKDKN